MFIDRCNDVRVEGLSFQDSGFWNLHLYHCREVVVAGLRINAPAGSPSTDGIDVDSCQNVVIRQCQISNNDDDIALKGSKGPLADKDTDSPPDENILIEDCVIGNGNGLLTCGSEATIVRDVTVRNCTITGNAKLLTLKLRPDTPQHYSNITIDGIKLSGRGSILSVAPWTQYFDLKGEVPPVRSVDHIVIRNVTGTAGSFGTLRGNTPNPQRGTLGDTIGDFTFENINLTLANPAPLARGELGSLVYKNVVINGQPAAAPPATAAGRGARGGGRGAPANGVTPAAPATVQ
jgi:alpha-L-rhamnosidase